MRPKFSQIVLASLGFAIMTALPLTADAANSPKSGKAQLERLLKPHFFPWTVTKAARAAAGDANMVVLDRRGIAGEVYRCSFITLRGKRAMVCD